MKPRDVKLSRRVAIDYMLIGIAMGGSAKLVAEYIEPSEMLTDVGKMLMKAVLDQDRTAIVDVFHGRGYKISDQSSVCQQLIQIIKESNAEQSAMGVAESMAEQMQSFTDLDDILDYMEKCVFALKTFRQHEKNE